METTNTEEIIPSIGIRDTRQVAVHIILGSILFECIAFYSLTDRLGTALQYTKTLNWTSSENLSHISYIFSGTEFLSMLLFAIISDTKLSRAKTIILGFPLYIIGFSLFTMITSEKIPICPTYKNNSQSINSLIDEHCADRILPILIFTAIGAGAVRSNIIAFGADQIIESKETSLYIDKFVIIINLASIIETLADAYIPHQGTFFIFFLVANLMLFIAAILFFIGWKYYIHMTPYNSAIKKFIPVYKNAFQTWIQYRRTTRQPIEQENLNISYNSVNDEIQRSTRINPRPYRFLDFAKLINNGKYQDWIVDDVKLLRNALIILILVFPYRLIFYQLYSSFAIQAGKMKNRTLLTSDLILLCEPTTIIIGVFILNKFVYKYLRARNRSLTIANKFIISMFFAFLNMCIAGGVELWRQNECHNKNPSDLTIWVQIPQYIGMGMAQLFGLLASFEFAYFFAPRSAQSLFMSLHFISRGIASYFGVACIIVLKKYSYDMLFNCPINTKYRWDYFTYFFVLAGLQLIFIILFIICQKTYRMIRVNRQ